MKSKLLVTIVLLILSYIISAQNPYLVLTYTAEDNGAYIQLDSIKVMNRTQDCDTVLYWPDTVLVLGSSFGIQEPIVTQDGLQVFQNYPNPVVDRTIVKIFIPEKGLVNIMITDVFGRVLHRSEMVLEQGYHSFRYTPGNSGISFFTASIQDWTSSIRVLSTNSYTSRASLEYIGSAKSKNQAKAKRVMQNFSFSFGDTLLYIGYSDTLESGILQAPITHDTSTFQFAYNIPCPGTPTITYEGQVYNTVQIFSQCWLKENLNVGEMVLGTMEQSDNGTIEKYCYNNKPDSCMKYGGLYHWAEMMQYITQQGTQGICPPGWHLPTDEEWKVLEGAVDSQYGIGDPVWDNYHYRGYDAGTNLKVTSGWRNNGNGTDLFGFSGLPGGGRYTNGYFYYVGIGGYGLWWTSTEDYYYSALYRSLNYVYPEVSRYFHYEVYGFSVRCLRD
ncbi:MAG: hypothetical protein K8R63_10680 [Bacteroidales bacterium]|nr:hypothetical protein [Bacteroidales bacterium]